jgi:ferritin-like metal-binding protein YciE
VRRAIQRRALGIENPKQNLRKMKITMKKTGSQETDTENSDMENNELHELFLDELADALHAEQQLTKALHKMVKAAKSEELRTALEEHLEETNGHISRLEQVFELLDEKSKAKPCKGMKGILEEGDEMVKEMKDTGAIDATVIAAGQKVEHYEIASYGTLVAWAEQMGHDDAAQLLKQTLEEEKAADEKLTEIALSLANEKAEQN